MNVDLIDVQPADLAERHGHRALRRQILFDRRDEIMAASELRKAAAS